MQELAKMLLEYSTIRYMGGGGGISDIGDERRFHNGKALIAYTGIDPPPYESGQFARSKRWITKRGSPTIRKVGYEVMRVL